jgi:hypothetical protein
MRSLRLEKGAALVLALLAMTVVSALGVGLVLSTMVEGTIASGFSTAYAAFYAAEAALEWGVARVSRSGAWDTFLGAEDPIRFPSAGSADILIVTGPELTAALQLSSDTRYGLGPNRPVWRLLGHGPLGGLARAPGALPYVAVWVADDPDEQDNAPDRDTNGIVVLHAEGHGTRDSRRVVEAILARAPGFPPRLLVWRELRDGM